MKIYAKTVWQWVDDELVRVPSEEVSFEYDGPVELLKGGGGGGQQYYENLNRLYGIQADQADYLGNLFKNNVAPAYNTWLDEAQGYGSQANQEQQAQRAMSDVSAAMTSNNLALHDRLASLGINPADERYANIMANNDREGMARMAQMMTGARENVRQQGFARTQDAIGMGMGTPTQASAAANSATNAAQIGMQGQIAQQQQNSNNVAGIVRGGATIINSLSGDGMANGGLVRLKGGGYVQKMAAGGFLRQPQIQAPPPMGGPQPGGGAGLGIANTGLGMAGMKGAMPRAIEGAGNLFQSPQMAAFGRGMQLNPAQGKAAADAYAGSAASLRAAAQAQIDKAIGAEAPINSAGGGVSQSAMWAPETATGVAGEGAEAFAPEAAGYMSAGEADAALASANAAAAEGAAGLGEAATLGGVGEAVGAGSSLAAGLGAAVPVLGAGIAAYGIGNALGWWADGGRVTPGSYGARGGQVDGPGGPKDDEVPAMLSDGEFVMPVGAVKYFGLDRLEKMRQKGLEYEKHLGISRG